MKPLGKILAAIAFGFTFFGCVSTEHELESPHAHFIVGDTNVTEADTIIRVGDTLSVHAENCEGSRCGFQWKLVGPDSQFHADENNARFVAEKRGEYTLSLYVWKDFSGKKISGSPIYFHIKVRGPFLIDAGEDKSVAENETVSFAIAAAETEADSLALALPNSPSGARFDAEVFSWTPGFDQAGKYPLVFRGLSQSLEALDSVLITVTNVDRPPTLLVPDEKSGEEGVRITFRVAASDSDGDTVNLEVSDLPSGAEFDSGTFSWTPTFQQSGRHRVRFTASSGRLSETGSLLVIVRDVDRKPLVQPITAQTAVEGRPMVLAVSAPDPDGDTVAVVAEGLPSEATFAGQIFKWTPSYRDSGSHTVTFIASARGLSDTQVVAITVSDSNRGPWLNSGGNRFISEGQTLTLTVGSSDPDGDSLVVEVVDPPHQAFFDGSAFLWTPGFDQAGSYSLIFRGRSNRLVVQDTLLIVVANTDRPPTSDAGPDLSSDEGALLSRRVMSSDADGDSITVTLLNPPAGAAFAGDSFSWTPAFTQAGSYQLVFRARSNDLQAFDTLAITIANVDRPPLLVAPASATIDEGRRGTFQVSVSDPDGDAVIVSAQVLPPGATFDTLAFAWTPGYQDSGLHSVRLFAIAGTLADSQEVEIMVFNVNRAPIASAGPDTIIVLGDSTRLGGSGTDADGDSPAYRWSAPTGAALSDASAPMPWFRPGSAGQFLFALRVRDQADTSAPDFAKVTVLDTAPSSGNHAPVADAGADRKLLLGDIVVLNGLGSSDPDGDPLRYIWRPFQSNPDTSFKLDSAANLAFRPSLPGRYGFILYVFDGEKFSSPDQVQIEINSPDWQVSLTRRGGIYVGSLSEALDSASSGDTIYVEPGNHVETRDVFVGPQHGDVYIFGIDPAATVIDLGCRFTAGNVFALKNTNGVKVEGLTFRHGGRGDESQIDSAVGGVVVHNSARIQLVNVVSEHNCGDGLRLINSNLVTISGSRINDNASNGIRTTSSAFDLVRSALRDNGESPSFYGGIAIEGDSTQIGLEDDTLQNNRENQIKATNRSRLIIRNVRFAGTGGGIATTPGAHPDLDIAGCTFEGNTGSAIFCRDGGSVEVRNSLFDKAGLADSNKAVDFISCAGRLESNRFRNYSLAVTLAASAVDIVGNTFSGNSIDARVSGGDPPCPAFSANVWEDPPPALDYSNTSCPEPGAP